MIEERGQAFDAYRLLIGAVMGMLILVIIVSAITYFEDLRLEVSKQRFYDGLDNAVAQPNGEKLFVDSLVLKEGERFSSSQLASYMGLEDECVLFGDSGSGAFSGDDELVVVETYVLASMNIVCETNFDSPSCSCDVCCTISFDAN